MIEMQSVESLGEQLETLSAQVAEIVERHRQLLEQRPIASLRAYEDRPGARDQLHALDTQLETCGAELRNATDAAHALEQTLIEATERKRQEDESKAAQDRYVEEVRSIEALRERNRAFV